MLLKMNVAFCSDEYYGDQWNICVTHGNEKCVPNFHINWV